MNFKSLFILVCLFCTFVAAAQTDRKTSLRYYGKEVFLTEGIAFTDSVRENPYDRFPLSAKGKVRDAVWYLSTNSAGITVRFSANSSSIGVRWKIVNGKNMDHMAATGIRGIDLYGRTSEGWQYISTGIPKSLENEVILVEHMPAGWREYLVNLPLYDGVTRVEVGIDSLGQILKPEKRSGKPIVFYGTSITQGGCASRPGMAYTNIISRKLGVECLNFGFSGNGKMEKEVVDLLSEIDAAFFVIDCVPNMKPEEIRERVIPLVETIRRKHPRVPIVFVDGPVYEKSNFDTEQRSGLEEKSRILEEQYRQLTRKGKQKIFLVSNKFSTKSDHEGTVDGVHFTDLGFMRFSEHLISEFRRFKLLKELK